MSQLIAGTPLSLLFAFVLGCFVAWIWRGLFLNKRIRSAEQAVEARLQSEIETLRSDLARAQGEIDQQREQLERHADTAEPDDDPETLRKALTALDERYKALQTRWERERVQFAQLVAYKNHRIEELEHLSSNGEQAVIEDGTSLDVDEDNSSYSRQQLETMLVDLRARVAEQESELVSLRSQPSGDSEAGASATSPVVDWVGNSDAALQASLAAKDEKIASLTAALNSDDTMSRLAQTERERADLLHRVSTLSSQRASDAELMASLHRDIESLRSELGAARTTLGEREQSLAALQFEFDTLGASLQDAARVSELEACCMQLGDQVTNLKSLLDTATTARDAVENQAALRAEKRTLQSELNAVQAALNTLKRDRSSLDQQLQRANTELAELRPIQHQLLGLKSRLGDLVGDEENSEFETPASAEIESLRTRFAQLQADSKLNLERKEHYYQGLLREKSAQIAKLKNESTASGSEA